MTLPPVFILSFAVDYTEFSAVSSLHNVFLYLRHFHAYLKENGYAAPDCVELFSHKVQRENHVQGYVTDLSLNTENLRECALDFSVIPLEGGVFRD